ncbi:hypothetical protein GCM10009665_10780 [Kitasatospora nipponensis]|uniref:Uncharacterized protein n=1 Tax=Kitasatospora nipponensis TaxID=258049 RepID=A0ABN1VVD4_9ACTN
MRPHAPSEVIVTDEDRAAIPRPPDEEATVGGGLADPKQGGSAHPARSLTSGLELVIYPVRRGLVPTLW